jgi:catecholate siderophore receptor
MFTSTDNRVVLSGFTRVDGAVFFDVTSRVRAEVNAESLFDERYYASAHSNNNITPGLAAGRAGVPDDAVLAPVLSCGFLWACSW